MFIVKIMNLKFLSRSFINQIFSLLFIHKEKPPNIIMTGGNNFVTFT